ncbi:DNA-binding protein [Paenibacillus athensensis]|uniref:Helix-turn-helix domain-containing protein n=1 Tax=Paenibacillus athensensis TaxID=1967502 RepID=A0A4Y8QAZ8_9BACL|nr:DNA-binding protein [Paenibacillus athensensis]MCD1260023.1 DNA-binding protein [Paenibacillus athensensis]
MSLAIYRATKEQIQTAYENNNEPIIEKETHFIFDKLLTIFMAMSSDKVLSVKMNMSVLALIKPAYLFSAEHRTNLLNWLDRLAEMKLPLSDLDFGKLKIDFEHWYYELGGTEIQFEYHESYLLTPSEAADALGVSTVTIHKYAKQGMEMAGNGTHKKYPKYVIDIMKDPSYSFLMRMNYQTRKMRNQTPWERLKEVNDSITEFQLRYGKMHCKDQFGEHDDSMDDPTDYYRWKDLEEEQAALFSLIGGKSSP